jgi:hypothetical protein
MEQIMNEVRKLYNDDGCVLKEASSNDYESWSSDGTRGDSPGCGSILIAFGEDNAEILRTCDIAGKYVRIN